MWSFSYPMEEQYYCYPIPRITIPRFADLPLPDLPVAEGEFETLTEIPRLVNYMDGTESPDRARFWLGYDSNSFVLIGRLYGPIHGRDDIIEDQLEHEQLHIVINPTPKRLRGFRIRLRPGGVMSIDSGGEDAPGPWWDESGEIRQVIEEDGWSFAVRIPFSLLGVECPDRGQVWRINLFRYLYKRQEDNSSWSVMYLGRIDIPERYGEVVFGDDVSGGILEDEVAPGRSKVRWMVRSEDTRKLSLEVLRGEEIIFRRVVEVDTGRRVIGQEFELGDGGSLLLRLVDDRGESIATWPVNTGCMEIGPRIGKLHRAAISLMESGCSRVAEGGWEVMEGVKSLKHRAASNEIDPDSWHGLELSLRSLERTARILEVRSGLSKPDGGVALLAVNSLTKIIRGLPVPDIFSEEGELAAPGRGSDSVQLVVFAFDEDLEDCEMMISTLVGPESEKIPGNCIELYRVGDVVTRRPRYLVKHVGPHPDPLMPASSFNVRSGGYEVFWLTVSLPCGVRPGTYRGWAEVKSGGSARARIPLSLQVWGFDLPARTTLRTAFPMFEREIERFYGRPLEEEMRWRYYDFLLRRRISPSCQYEKHPRPREEDMERVMSRETNVVSMGYLEYDELDSYISGIRPMVEFLRSRGWLKWAYAYGFDEVGPPGYERLKEAYGRLGEAYPDLPRACTIGPEHDLPEIFGTVDIWIPQTDRFERVYHGRQSAGDELWWYVSMWPRHPFANMFVDYPAIDHRILFWQSWKFGITGFLYYCINLWSSNCTGQPLMEKEVAALPDSRDREAIEAGSRWPEVPWNTYTGPTATNGDGQLIYPGTDGGPLSSVRLECVRHGIEDYELLAMLKCEVESARDRGASPSMLEEAEALLDIPPEVCRDLTRYTDDPGLLLETRKAVGEMIERLSCPR